MQYSRQEKFLTTLLFFAVSSAPFTMLGIDRFCGLKGHEMFCEVERSYIEDGFNLYGLRACVSNFSDCLDLILDRIGPDDSDDSHLTQSACALYGLIHARYIITAHGLDAMYNKVRIVLSCAGGLWASEITSDHSMCTFFICLLIFSMLILFFSISNHSTPPKTLGHVLYYSATDNPSYR
jgi:hypothetical protein